jgi:hypothetical protein
MNLKIWEVIMKNNDVDKLLLVREKLNSRYGTPVAISPTDFDNNLSMRIAEEGHRNIKLLCDMLIDSEINIELNNTDTVIR